MRRTAVVLAAAALVSLAGCSSSDMPGDRIGGHRLTIYSSLPLLGASSAGARAVIEGEQLALEQVGGRVGPYRIVLRALDDSTIARSQWDPGQTTLNAKLAAQDPTTIGYVGELNSGASAISIPLLNRTGIPQVSPGSGAVGLLSDAPGSAPGEPDKYYPTGRRTFVRVAPGDAVQAAVQVDLQRRQGCTSTYVLDDGEVDGQALATSFSLAAKAAGLTVVGVAGYPPLATDYSSLAAAVAQTGANCVLVAAIRESDAARVARQVAAALPQATIFCSAGLAESSFTDPTEGGIPPAVASRVLITAAAFDPTDSQPAVRSFMREFTARFGQPSPNAVLGYEAMRLLLGAIDRSTAGGRKPARRSRVLAALLPSRGHPSLLGTYSVRTTGDTTLRRYGLYRVADGQLRFVQAVVAPRSLL